MSKKNWLKAHKKQVITHTSIVVGFALFLIFLSEPLFDRFARVAGESQLYETTVPSPTNNIQYGFDRFELNANFMEIEGWAFISGHDYSVNDKTYIILKSTNRMYVFTTGIMIRNDVTEYFKELDLNLDYSGFEAFIPIRKIASDEYSVMIYIKNSDVESLQYINEAIVKSKSGVKCTVRMSELQEISLPPESEKIRFWIERHEFVIEETGKEYMEIAGWAFIEGQHAEDSKIYVVLKSKSATYVFDTILQKRPDVTAYFKELNLNLDNSRFIAKISKENVKKGRYKLGIYIKKGDMETLRYTSTTVEF